MIIITIPVGNLGGVLDATSGGVKSTLECVIDWLGDDIPGYWINGCREETKSGVETYPSWQWRRCDSERRLINFYGQWVNDDCACAPNVGEIRLDKWRIEDEELKDRL